MEKQKIESMYDLKDIKINLEKVNNRKAVFSKDSLIKKLSFF